MGHKVHPKSIRLGYIKDWDSKWFNLKEMPEFIEEDQRIRGYVKEKLQSGAVARVVIERAGKYLRVNIHTARPGIVIGKGGQGIETLRSELEEMTGRKTFVNVMEIKNPEINAQLVADAIAMQLEKQVSFRRALKRAMERAMASGAQGIKIMVSGRIGGAEIARTEWMKEGRVPLQTFRADIDYGFSESFTTMGLIGVKVWIFIKELFKKSAREMAQDAKIAENILQVDGKQVKDVKDVLPMADLVGEVKDISLGEDNIKR